MLYYYYAWLKLLFHNFCIFLFYLDDNFNFHERKFGKIKFKNIIK